MIIIYLFGYYVSRHQEICKNRLLGTPQTQMYPTVVLIKQRGLSREVVKKQKRYLFIHFKTMEQFL